MKKPLILLALPALLFAGCAKDSITTVDTDAMDDVANLDIDCTVAVVFSTSGSATVSGTGDSITASVSGNDVTIVNSGSDVVQYNLSGTTTDGFLKIYSTKKQAIVLNGVSITNPNGAAINVQGTQSSPSSGKAVYLVVSGSNTLADGTSYTDTPDNEDEKGVIFAEGQIILSGSGSLTVNATGKAGIASDDYVRFMSSPTVTVSSSAGHGVRGKDYIEISDGTIDISVSANMKKGMSSDSLVVFNGGQTSITITGGTAYDSEDGEYTGSAGIKADALFQMADGTLTITNSGTGGKGISCDGDGEFSGGTINITCTGSNYGSSGGRGNSSSSSVSAKGIKCDGDIEITGGTIVVSASGHEGIESKGEINISGGQVYSYSSDDAMNSAGDFTISGGYVCGYSSGNDGLDANGDFYVKGGVVYAISASSPEVGIDANTEGGYQLYVTGGTLIAVGGLESGASLTQSCYSASSWSTNTWYALTVGSTVYAFKTPSSGGSPLAVSGSSTPSLVSGVSVSGGTSYLNGMMNIGCSVSGGTSVSLSSYSGGNSGGGGGGNPGGGGPGGH